MWRTLGVRFARTVGVLLLVTVCVFGLTALLPGDPAVALAGDDASPELVESIRTELGLDKPLYAQYISWLAGLVQGDLGTSLYSSEAVTQAILNRLPVTLSLTAVAIVIAVVIGVSGGILAARRPGGLIDRGTTVFATLGITVPNFWLAMMFVILFSLILGWLPAVGYTPLSSGFLPWLSSVILPAVALGAAGAAEVLRQTRSSMIDVLSQDYIRTAKAQGISGWAVFWERALKNASVPIVTVIGFQFALLLGGAVIIEKIFSLPGIGSLVIDAVLRKDLPIIQGVVLVNALVVLIINVLTDVAYTVLNPKVRA